MRATFTTVAVLLVFSTFAQAIAGDKTLPEPKKTGGMPVLEAMDQRASAGHGGFPTGKLSDDDLATILWAATGKNRDGKLWTVPMAMGRPPYVKIYAATDDGVYLYKWDTHALEEISKDSVNGEIIMQKAFHGAPVTLYLVLDGEMLGQFNPPISEEAGLVLAGAMSQNIYLACEAVNVGTRVIYSIKRATAEEAFGLSDSDTPVFAMPLGKK